ncbi:hypothetical protein FTO74_11590 [Granulicella sp. WH15]|uniref:hypothetical protein n=1 Tax=Granulicella sp. WH15 TaxID=2602070 RepID=UPI00136780CE|nr:hypothetical protein [Granulicella sp. WH15]QHN03942.1 hypothetical protein FTO74_11590 [Granulicella sp. WH15]
MLLKLIRSLRFLWNATRGNRMRPWRSEYLRWRMETYTGKPAATLRLRDFLSLMFGESRQFLRFLMWTADMQAIAHSSDGARK